MRTLAILVLTLLTMVLSQTLTVDPKPSPQITSIPTPVSNTQAQMAEETTPTPDTIEDPMPSANTSEAAPIVATLSTWLPTATSEPVSTTTRLHKMSTSSTSTSTSSHISENSTSKTIIVVVLFIILVILVSLGCIHRWWQRRSTHDHSTPRLLLSMEQRLRAGTNYLGGRIGVVLWPGSKRGGEEEEEEEGKEGVRQGDVEEGGQERESSGNRRGEESDSSDDYSSLEGNDLQEEALRRQEEEKKKQRGDEDGNEVKSSVLNDGQHSPAEDEESRKTETGLEEMALISSSTEEDENAEVCDETIF